MKSMTIKLPAQLSARVARLARKRQVSRSDVVRQALEALPDEEADTFIGRFGHLAGTAKELPSDLSTHKRHLKGFGE
jgi:metal-responsive CopG/Arc/MetJ family transcriptional regulator